MPNGYSRSFDLDGRINGYTLGNTNIAGSWRQVGYDAAGRIKTYRHATNNTVVKAAALDQGFDYDALGRLVRFTSATLTQTYKYDLNGNRITLTNGGSTYTNTIHPASNRLMGTSGPVPARTMRYDDAGNLLSDGVVSYTYSPRGRMATSTVGGTVTTYRYNGLGQRVWQKSSGEAANPAGIYVYDEAGKLLGEYDTATGKPAREIIYHQGIPVAVLSYRVTGTAPNQVWSTEVGYVFTDHLNTPRVIARASDNKVVWCWDDADPFGVAPPNENPSGLGTFTFNMRMPGQYYDRATNLFYNYFRDYDPETGRYIESDPIGLGGGINTYSYVSGNPVSRFDPRGLDCVASGGTVSCNVPGGPHISFSRPAGWPDRLGPGRANYHYYNEWVKTGGLDKKSLEDYVRNHPTPGSPSAATSSGTPNNASPSWVPSFMPSPVTSYAMNYNGNQVIVNVTMPGHPLFPGYVARMTDADGTMNNFGEGTGALQAGYSPFSRPINNVWQGLSDDAINACSCKK